MSGRWVNSVAIHLRLVLLAGLLANLIVLGAPSVAFAAGCEVSGPVAGSYTVTVCITDPADGATVSGPTSVTATASAAGGPGVQKLVFYLDGQYLLTDYQSPYTFTLPSDRFVDGAHSLQAAAVMRDMFESQRASIGLVFSNGVTSPPPPATGFTPTSGTAPAPGRPLVVAATGDGAGGEPRAGDVTDLVASWNPNLFLYLGDVYEKGTATEFANWYKPTSYFGRFDAITDPTIGNHEYENGQAPGYFDYYWRSPPHYYSFDASGWHFISLDSTAQFGQTNPGSAQYQWLQNDLAANTAPCTLAYFHHPVYNVGPELPTPRMNSIWSLLDANGVDVVLTGHDHDYQRWVPLDGNGAPDAAGITQFVAGGGGHGIQQFVTTDSRLAKGFDTAPEAFGALRLELNARGAGYRYVNTAGTLLDSGSIACDGATDTTAPTAPAGVTATAAGSHEVDLSWTASTDNVGVTGYDIFRNDALVASVGPETSYTDTTVAAELTYRYEVRARDAAGNPSALSGAASVTTPAGENGLFADDFESGGWSKRTSNAGLTVQQQQVFSGSWAARANSTGAATWAYKRLDATQTSLYYRIRFKLISQASTVNLLKFRTASGGSLLGVYVASNHRLSYRNDVSQQSVTSTTDVSTGVWHTLQVHVVVNGAASQTETWLDDVPVGQLSRTESLGPDPVGRIQLGENSTGRTYDVAFDDVVADTARVVG
jgi:hypothetical protein